MNTILPQNGDGKSMKLNSTSVGPIFSAHFWGTFVVPNSQSIERTVPNLGRTSVNHWMF